MRTIWCAAWAVVSMITGALAAPPETPKSPVVDEYHGVKVSDDYRWLEDWDTQKVKSWSEAQNVHARSVLDALPKGINYSGYIGHCALRTYVMGERAFSEQATPDELKRMQFEVQDAVRAGAIGWCGPPSITAGM